MEVWVGCLACYNAGALRGEWVDGTEAAEFVPCKGRGHEEWWIFDHQDTGGLLTGECSPIEAQRIAEAIEAIEKDGYPVEAVAAWLDNEGETLTEWDRPMSEAFAEAFCGEWRNGADYAQELADDIGAVPEDVSWPLSCIDWEQAWRELRMGGDNYEVDAPGGGVYIFRNV